MSVLDQIQKSIPDEAKTTIGEKAFYYGGLFTTTGLAFFNNNAEGIQALCALLVAATVVAKYFRDRKREP